MRSEQNINSCIVLGANGFIGSAVTAECKKQGLHVTAVDLDNYEECRGAQADLLINAAGNSKKYIDDQNPSEGFKLSVLDIHNALLDFSAPHWIHLSSGAIYPHENNPNMNHEQIETPPTAMTRYGFHKWLAEQLVLHYVENPLIVRMGGFVGPGLKKNSLYDLLTNSPLFVHPESRFQIMDTRDLAKSILTLFFRQPDETLFNVCATGTISVKEAAEIAQRTIPTEAYNNKKVHAELNVTRASLYIDLPDSRTTVTRFIHEIQRGELVLS